MQVTPTLNMLGMGLRPGRDTELRGMDSSLSKSCGPTACAATSSQ
jgi:hypothetical protein